MTSTSLWTLIAIQIAMAAFDTIYHHEMTERLVWRPKQRRELALHAARSLLYAALFLTLGFFEPRGLWAMLIVVVLSVEVVITLTDFVEEDMTRKLPATERVTHTLLALNYGAILVLLLPVLLAWAALPTAIKPVFYGLPSVLAPVAALGAIIFGTRELAASLRSCRLGHGCVDTLVDALGERQAVLVTGATGFIGTRLVEALTAAGHDVTVLTRNATKASTLRPPFRLVTSLEQIPTDARIDAIINFAGEPIANGLWTRAKRRRIIDSRLHMTADVIELISQLERPPSVLVNASAVGGQAIVRLRHLRSLGDRGTCGRAFRRPRCAVADRDRAGHRRRHVGPASHPVRIRLWSCVGVRPAMDSVDRARRYGAVDRARHCSSGAFRPSERNRARTCSEHRVHQRTRARAASSGSSANSGLASASCSRRSRR